MAKKINIENMDNKNEIEILDETLHWLEDNVENKLDGFVKSCRRKFADKYANYFLDLYGRENIDMDVHKIVAEIEK